VGRRCLGLAVIVFVASIAVPVLKIAALALLAWSVRKAPDWRRLERARLFPPDRGGRSLVDA
jgi:paraquat-inducible protein A